MARKAIGKAKASPSRRGSKAKPSGSRKAKAGRSATVRSASSGKRPSRAASRTSARRPAKKAAARRRATAKKAATRAALKGAARSRQDKGRSRTAVQDLTDVTAEVQERYDGEDDEVPTPPSTLDLERRASIGRAVGVDYEDAEELKSTPKVETRDRKRWEPRP